MVLFYFTKTIKVRNPEIASTFRFPITGDSPGLGCILPSTGRIQDFHLLERTPAGRIRNRNRA